MATGDSKVNAVLKRFLSQNRLAQNVITYLKDLVVDLGSEMFPSQGLFTYPVAITYSAGSFDLSITPSGDIRGTDGIGNILELVTTRQSNISFEDTATEKYWIALQCIEIVSGVYVNPRTTLPEYDLITDEVGEVDEPTDVTDNGSNITFNVNSIFESGVDHSGRTVRVWLKNPVSDDAAVAFEDCTVAYSSPNNTITTVALLGQGTVSTTEADYQVACLGVTVRKSATDPFGAGYLKLGYVVGGGGTSIDNTVDLSAGGGHTLQKAYDGISGSGSGRIVTVADQAVFLKQESVVNRDVDIANAALRIDKDVPTTLPDSRFVGEVAIDTKIGLSYPGAHIIRVPLADYSGGDKLRVEEDVDLVASTANIDFTRGGSLDLTLTGLNGQIQELNIDLIEISNSTLGQNGVFFINSLADPDTLSVRNLDDTTPSFTAESGLKARISRPVVQLGRQDGAVDLTLMNDFYKDLGGVPYYQEGVRINVPENAAATDPIINVVRESVGRLLKLLGDGELEVVDLTADNDVVAGNDVVADQNITATNGDITASAGDVVANQDLIAGVGVLALTGNIVATLGDITASDGDVIADNNVVATNGSISATSGSVAAATTVTGGTGVTATTGNVNALAGNVVAGVDVTAVGDVTAGDNVEADNDVIADADASGVGNFRYGTAKVLFKSFSASDFMFDPADVAGVGWFGYYWQALVGSTVTLYAPIHIPDGVTVTQFAVKMNATNHPTNVITVQLIRVDLNMGTSGSPPVESSPVMSTLQSTGNGWQTLSDTTITDAVINNDQYGYYAKVQFQNSGDQFGGCEVRYECTTISMN